jgi:hypothetical protein
MSPTCMCVYGVHTHTHTHTRKLTHLMPVAGRVSERAAKLIMREPESY